VIAKSKGNAMSLLYGSIVDELLADSLIKTVMRADQVEPQAFRALLNAPPAAMAAGRRQRAASAPAWFSSGHQANDEAEARIRF
jgi:hypothetical protein